jgi:hypothetical protein
MDPFTRFTVLDPEEMAWFEHWHEKHVAREADPAFVVVKDIPATPENVAMAERIGKKLPVRKRWRRQDRFGYRWYTKKNRATHFNLMCRFNEIQP